MIGSYTPRRYAQQLTSNPTVPRPILRLRVTACPLWDKQCGTSLCPPPQIHRSRYDDVVSPNNKSKTKITASPKTPKQWHPALLNQ